MNSIETKKSEAGKPLKFNPFDAEFRANPYPIYHRFRSESPIHRISNFTGNEWLLTSYAYVKAVLNDLRFCADDLPDRLKQKSFYLKQEGEFETLRQTISSWLFFLNPPHHSTLRGVVGKAFSPGVVENMRPQVQKIVDELIDSVQEDGVMDIIHDLACPLPATVTAMMLGMPIEERDKLAQWAHDLFRVFDQPLSLEVYKHLNQVSLEFKEFISELIKEREKSPKEDLLSHLIAAKKQGGKLNDEELMGFCAMLFSVGQETTENFIGNSMLALLRHPDQLQRLKQEPTIINSAVEELLRYDSPVQLVARVATEDVEIGGKTIKAGDRVHLSLGAANRDPAEFAEPDCIQLNRKHNSIPFGSGIHYCLGGALARLQGQVAIGTLIRRFPELKLNTDKLEWRSNIVLRGLKTLPVAFKLSD
jgi:pimeloyl-[acyl-carrier protein] synthase